MLNFGKKMRDEKNKYSNSRDVRKKKILNEKNPSGRGVQHYVIKFVSDLRQVGGFLRGPPVSSTS